MNELNLIQAYINDIENTVKVVSTEDVFSLFKKLYSKEQLFAKKLKSLTGQKIYKDLIQEVVDSSAGIRSARNYFRLRQKYHKETINRGMAEVNPTLYYKVPINHKFCKFALDNLPRQYKSLEKLYQEIIEIRQEIVTKHLYLALNRAKIFNKSSYGAYINLEDLIQLANEALVVAVDKFVIEGENSNFHHVAIGRMIASFIEHSNTFSSVSIGPSPGKRLYKIKRVLQGNPSLSNKEVSEILEIAENEVNDLLGATSYKSLDDQVSKDNETRNHEIFVDKTNTFERQDVFVEKKEQKKMLFKSLETLSVIELKILILKGLAYSYYLEKLESEFE